MKKLSKLTMVRTALLISTGALTLGGCGGVVSEEAEKEFLAKLGETTITVFPVFVRDGEEHRYDAAGGERIAQALTESRAGAAQVSDGEVPIAGTWGMNESKMYRASVEDFAKYVQQNPIATEYALLAEYLIGGKGAPVGVHVYVVDAAGTPSAGMGFNSHHAEFNAVNPQTVEDCTTIVVNAIAEEWGR